MHSSLGPCTPVFPAQPPLSRTLDCPHHTTAPEAPHLGPWTLHHPTEPWADAGGSDSLRRDKYAQLGPDHLQGLSRTRGAGERGGPPAFSTEEGTLLPPPSRPSSTAPTRSQSPLTPTPAPLDIHVHSVRLFNTTHHPSRQPTSLRFRTQPPTLHALQHHPDPTPPSVSLCLAFCHLLLDPGSTCPVTFPPISSQGTSRGHPHPLPSPKTHSHASTHSCPDFSHTHPCLYSAFTLHHSSRRPARRLHGALSPSLSVLSPSRTPVHSSCHDLALGFWTQQPPPPTLMWRLSGTGSPPWPSTKPHSPSQPGAPSLPTPTHHLPAPREGDGAAPCRTHQHPLSVWVTGARHQPCPSLRLDSGQPCILDSEWRGRGLWLTPGGTCSVSARTSISGCLHSGAPHVFCPRTWPHLG